MITPRFTLRRVDDHIDIINHRGTIVAMLVDGQEQICHDPYADSYALLMDEPATDWPQAIIDAGLDIDTIRTIDSMPVPDITI